MQIAAICLTLGLGLLSGAGCGADRAAGSGQGARATEPALSARLAKLRGAADELAQRGLWTEAAAAYREAASRARQGDDQAAAERLEAAAAAADRPELTNSIGMRFVLIPPGNFIMGSPEGENHRDSDERAHEVAISELFYLSATEVTQAQWSKLMPDNPSRARGAQRPVESVSWGDATRFAEALSDKEHETYRLPSEAEWEYACRAGTTSAYHYGVTLSEREANVRANTSTSSAGTVPLGSRDVGSYAPNAWGLFDMHGNVWEWVADRYAPYPGAEASPGGDARGGDDATERVLRGGAWNFSHEAARSAARLALSPERRYDCNGFRLARSIGGARATDL